MDEEKKKRGRPLKNDARRRRLHILISDDEYELLLYASIKSGKPMSEIARTGIHISAKGESDLYDLTHEDVPNNHEMR